MHDHGWATDARLRDEKLAEVEFRIPSELACMKITVSKENVLRSECATRARRPVDTYQR